MIYLTMRKLTQGKSNRKNKIVLVQQLGTNKYKFLDSEIFNEQHLKSLIKAKKTNPDDYNLTYVVGVYYFDYLRVVSAINSIIILPWNVTNRKKYKMTRYRQ